MKPISKIASGIQPSATLAMNSLAKELKAQGVDVISFSVGEPDFHTPEHIKKAGADAILSDKSYYTDASGIMPLKEAVCRYVADTYGVSYTPKNICVSSGAKHILFLTFQTILNPGDEVILPAPYWVTYAELIKMCGATPVVVETSEESGFKLSPEQLKNAITDKTKCLILTNPSNPSGIIYSKSELQALAEVIIENDLYLISDEIYALLVYEGEFVSAPALSEELKERTILINGVSKTYAMTGWRIGYCAANETIIKAMNAYVGHSTGNASNAAQYAALCAFTGDQSCTEEMKEEFNKRRVYFYDRVQSIEGISCIKPVAAFYVFMNVKAFIGKSVHGEKINSSADFGTLLLRYGLVATVPGEAFGTPGYIRWSYATSMENIKKGLDRLEAFVKTIE